MVGTETNLQELKKLYNNKRIKLDRYNRIIPLVLWYLGMYVFSILKYVITSIE